MSYYSASKDAKQATAFAMNANALSRDEGVQHLALAVAHLAKSVEEIAKQMHRAE